MSTMMDERTDERLNVTDDGDHDKFAHYARKTDIERAVFEGVKIIALCGKKWRPEGDYTKYPVCPECKEKFESLPAGE